MALHYKHPLILGIKVRRCDSKDTQQSGLLRKVPYSGRDIRRYYFPKHTVEMAEEQHPRTAADPNT